MKWEKIVRHNGNFRYECNVCHKRYKTVNWASEHSIKKHGGKARFKKIDEEMQYRRVRKKRLVENKK